MVAMLSCNTISMAVHLQYRVGGGGGGGGVELQDMMGVVGWMELQRSGGGGGGVELTSHFIPFQIKETTSGIGGVNDCWMVHQCEGSLTACTHNAQGCIGLKQTCAAHLPTPPTHNHQFNPLKDDCGHSGA